MFKLITEILLAMPKIFYFLLFLSNIALAQTEPSFQSRFFFEDAVGNKNTLYWGTDLSATLGIDSELGEVLIDEPFDSVFEVRATLDPYFSGDYTANPMVVPSQDLPDQFDCDVSNGGFFYILMSLRYPPVTITWDNADFNDICRLTSYFTPIEYNLVDTPDDDFWLCSPNVCLAESNSFQFDFLPESYGCLNAQDFGIYRTEELNNGVLDTLRGLIYEGPISQTSFGPCTYLVSDIDSSPITTEIEIYPNPTSDIIKIKSQNNVDWERMEVFTSQGERKSSQIIESDEFSYSFRNYPTGIYFLKFLDSKSHVIYSKKVIKM